MPVLHKHHIVPKHMGGDDSPDNLTPPISVALHAALHKDLYEELGNVEDLIAWRMLAGLSLSGFEFNNLIRKKLSESHKGKPNNQLGLKRSKESREKMRLAHLGKPRSKVVKEKISKSLIGNTRALGSKHTKKWKQENSLRLIGNTNTLGKKIHSKEHKNSLRSFWKNKRNSKGQFVCQS